MKTAARALAFCAGAVLAYFAHAAWGGRFFSLHSGDRLDRITGTVTTDYRTEDGETLKLTVTEFR